ncbi:alkaline phosphatase family protein [Halococcus saccharolyticus]|uniref:Type I phosphodiesterase/nucleotide pyrophosphatase n=1 Tax=Halococcus saccharolyticus DSM 5350 TaxID=1227455 RepID=M0MRY3_9EURY|nr:alkaline phosphatase family protein [Halococcus saccharolyticus]EMA47220.1 type I phosphodiesterase/nucleotide pyrophosphatase [Halococcus saccharolyticus DSM 5350]
MLRTDLAATLREDELAPGMVRPAWEDYSFGNVADTVLSLFDDDARRPLPEDVFDGVDTEGVEHVVVALVDGFGWNHFRRARPDHPFLGTLAERATVTPLTSIYPSETAAAITTHNTATQPVEHGVLGWWAYSEELGTTLQTLPFADADDEPIAHLHDTDASVLVDERSVYDRLSGDSMIVAPAGQADSSYSRQATRGARHRDYHNVAQGAYRVREELAAATDPTYCYLYVPSVDSLAHYAGVAHPETDAQLGYVLNALKREVVELLDPAVAERTLLVVTADHGEVDATPETTVDLRELALDEHLRRDANGDPIRPLGGPRNLQFHAREGHRDALVAAIETGLDPLDPLVVTREELLAENLFGDREPSERFERRCPDVLAVPRHGFADMSDEGLSYVGMHGGMHPDEMLVPFAAATIDLLQE